MFLGISHAQQQTVWDVLERYRAEILPKLSAKAFTSDPFRLNTVSQHLDRVSLARLC